MPFGIEPKVAAILRRRAVSGLEVQCRKGIRAALRQMESLVVRIAGELDTVAIPRSPVLVPLRRLVNIRVRIGGLVLLLEKCGGGRHSRKS